MRHPAGKQLQEFDVEDTVLLHFKTSSDAVGTIDLSWSITRNNEYYINIYGAKGSIHIGWRKSILCKSGESKEVVFGGGYNKLNAFIKQLSHFINCINGKENPIITGKDGIESIRVIKKAYESLKIDKWLKVDAVADEE